MIVGDTMEYKNILIGTDGGDLMAPVYDNAAYFARLTDATVHIAYVLDIAGFTAYPVDSSWENITTSSSLRERISSRTPKKTWIRAV